MTETAALDAATRGVRPRSVYERVMGEADFARLDAPVQAFHRLAGRHELAGEVRVEAPDWALGRLIARRMGLPTERAQGPLRFGLDATPLREQWTRHFPRAVFRSELEAGEGVVIERMGPLRLFFALEVSDGRLVMQLRRAKLWGLPCPGWALPQVIAEESGRGERLHFLVRAAMPLVGRFTGYTGFLVLPDEAFRDG